MLRQKPFYASQRKNGFFQFGFGRVNGVVVAGAEIGFVGDGFRKFGTVQIAVVKKDFGQFGRHEIYGDEAAMGKGASLEFQRIEFGEIQDAIVEMNFKNQLVAHGKIDFLDFAMIESHSPQSHMVYFGMTESTIVKNTIDKGDRYKIT